MPNIEQAVKELQDAILVIAEIEKRQSALLREHSERIVNIEHSLARSAQLNEEIREIQKHGDERLKRPHRRRGRHRPKTTPSIIQVHPRRADRPRNLAEITDKLNGLIGYVRLLDASSPPSPRPGHR